MWLEFRRVLFRSDPPYDLTDLEKIPEMVINSGMMKKDTIYILEHSSKNDFSSLPEFDQLRVYGSVNFSFFTLKWEFKIYKMKKRIYLFIDALLFYNIIYIDIYLCLNCLNIHFAIKMNKKYCILFMWIILIKPKLIYTINIIWLHYLTALKYWYIVL